MKTTVVGFPFDLFGSSGTRQGVELLLDELREVLEDNAEETVPTRALAYRDQIRLEELDLDKLDEYSDWRATARKTARKILRKKDFLLWLSGNHLGVLPVYEELSQWKDTVVLQLDAHLDIHNFACSTTTLSHGNFLLHSKEPLPEIHNLGHRELLIPRQHMNKYYRTTIPAEEWSDNLDRVNTHLNAIRSAKRLFIDIDCDVIDPVYFPAVNHPVPFGLTPRELLTVLKTVWSERVIGIGISEFNPAYDERDRSLAILVWLIERLWLLMYEEGKTGESLR